MARDEDHRGEGDWFAVDPKGRVRDPDAPRRGPPLLAVIAAVLLAGVGAVAVVNRMGATDPPRPSPRVSVSPGPAVVSGPARVSSPVPNPTAGPSVTVVGHRLLGVTGTWELFARGPGVLVRVEPAAGRVEATPVPLLNSSGAVSFVAGPERVLIRPWDNVLGYVVPDGGPARSTNGALAPGGPALPGPDPGQVWVQTGSDSHPAMSLVTLDGSSAGQPSVPVPPDMSPLSAQPDGAGSLIFEGANGAYAASRAGLHRITTGQVVAATASSWLVSDCDDRHHCSTALVDRATGDRRALGPALGDGVASGSVAPDGRFAAVPVGASGATSLLVIDLASGARRQVPVSLAPSNGPEAFGWSPDSRWLFVVTADQTVGVVDAATWGVRTLGVTLPPVDQVAIRPSPK